MNAIRCKYITKNDVYLILVALFFSLAVTLISFEYGVSTLIATITTVVYYLVFEKSVTMLVKYDHSKLTVISIYIVGLLRYVCIGGGAMTIFFLFSSLSVRLYAVIIIIMTWFICTGMKNRR